MPHHGISGNAFSHRCLLQKSRAPQQQLLDAPVLIAQLYFQVQDLLPVADKPEMPRFYHSGMNGPYPHFVQFIALHGIKRIVGNGLGAVGTVERVTYRLQPGMVKVLNPEILVNLPFKPLKSRHPGRKGRKGVPGADHA